MIFTDKVTLFNKISEDYWTSKLVEGVQWSDKTELDNNDGKISVARYAEITFPKGTYEDLILNASNEEDVLVMGDATAFVVDGTKGKRISDLLKAYQHAGRIKAVDDNSNRDYLKNMKVTVG